MNKKRRVPFVLIGLLSAVTGGLTAFGYGPLYEAVFEAYRENFRASPWDEMVITAFIGIFFIGVFIYLLSITVSSLVFDRIFSGFLKRLTQAEILPAGYKVKRGKGLTGVYLGLIKILDSFIDMFMTVKRDKDKFSKIVEMHLDPTVKMEMDDRGINEIYIGGKKKIQTVLFSDLRGFTAITEKYNPDDVVKILNEYLTDSTKIITRHRGKVNKYIGDAVLAVFDEAPKYAEYIAADKAVMAALDMQVMFQCFMKKWKETIDPNLNLGLGIGISKGEVIAGNIGSEERMEYTVIGDAVNMASRLCSVAVDGQVLISDDVYSVVEHLVEIETLPCAVIKGKKGTYNLYSIKTR
ncbi:MAG TPA: adenylate/guanylate cyclase domain-containing protein, partial [bacterium]|nr:adenylate/guanylate cyclase domain-containing protein [bacterium]